MDATTMDPGKFRGELKRWAGHCAINALPSFIVAAFYMRIIRSPGTVAAMVAGVGVFVVGYACLTTFAGDFAKRDSLVGRAVRAGTKVRMVMSLVSLPFLLPTGPQLFVPDVWAGVLAVFLVDQAGQSRGIENAVLQQALFSPADSTRTTPAWAVFATVVVEGVILSLLLFMASFFALLVIQRKCVKRAMAGGG